MLLYKGNKTLKNQKTQKNSKRKENKIHEIRYYIVPVNNQPEVIIPGNHPKFFWKSTLAFCSMSSEVIMSGNHPKFF